MAAMAAYGGKVAKAVPRIWTACFRSLCFLCSFVGLAVVLLSSSIPTRALGDSGEKNEEMIHARAGARRLMGSYLGPKNDWDTPFGENVTVQILGPTQRPPPEPTEGGFSSKEFEAADDGALTQVGSKTDDFGNLVMLDGPEQATKALWRQPFSMVDGKKRFRPAFRTSFTLDIQAASCLGEGVAFVITSDTRRGSGGRNIGYGGANSKSVIVEFDTFMNAEVGDIDSNHVGINLNGNAVSVAQASFATAYSGVPTDENSDKSAGQNPVYLGQAPVSVWIEYRNSILSIWASHSLDRPAQPVLSHSIDLFRYLQPQSYVGFTAASGGCQLSVATISNWDFIAETYDEDNPCLAAFEAGQVLCPTPNTVCNYEGPKRFSCS